MDSTIYNKRTSTPPDSAIYVGRPTRWGNPFTVEQYGRGQAVLRFAEWLKHSPEARWQREHIHELAGRDLICWCSPARCHAKVLAVAARAKADGRLASEAIDDLIEQWLENS